MSRYYGSVGYEIQNEDPDQPDVWIPTIDEHRYSGEIISNSTRWQQADKVNDDLTVSVKISILADPFAYSNFQHIKYATWMNAKWKVTNIEPAFPRIILTLGGVYNGPEQSDS